MIITIDGPAASGKSTTARALAKLLGFEYLDTGSLYRALTLAAHRARLAPEEGPELSAWLERLALRYRYQHGEVRILIGEEDVSEEIRSAEVTAQVSAYSALSSVRSHMVVLQRKFSRGRNLVAEGRDMGSVVFPEAELKIFLESSAEERARRRREDFRRQGREVDAETVRAELARRDASDSEREHSPLIKPEGAVVLDNSRMSIEEQVQAVMRLAEERRPGRRIGPDELVTGAPAAERRELIAAMRPFYKFCWLMVRGTAGLLFGLRIHHAERAAIAGPLLVAGNHISYLDPPLAGGAVPRELSYVAKRELFRFKPFGAFIAYVNAVPITRGIFDRACFDVLRERVRAGGAVLFFPEGTRKPMGRLGKAKFGVGLVAQETEAPVLPLFIKGSAHPLRCLLRRERLEIYVGRPLSIAPLVARGLHGRELMELFGEGLMAEIEGLQEEARASSGAPARKGPKRG